MTVKQDGDEKYFDSLEVIEFVSLARCLPCWGTFPMHSYSFNVELVSEFEEHQHFILDINK